MPEQNDDEQGEAPKKETCCLYRRKIVVGVIGVLPEEKCGVSDVELADLFDPDIKAASGLPVLRFRFCPWCGSPSTPDSEYRVTDFAKNEESEDESDPADFWKRQDEDDG